MNAEVHTTGVLVVGAGEAAVSAVQQLRNLGYAKPILLAGRERFLPYHRPPLSKNVLTSAEAEEEVWLRDLAFYDEQDIEVSLDTEVFDIQTTGVSGGRAETSRGVIRFEHLILATGARARKLPIPGAQLPGMHTLRGLDDVRELRNQLGQAREVVVIGSGFIGLEVAAAINSHGISVTVIGAEDRVLQRVSAAPVSDFLVGAHEHSGITFLLGQQVTEVTEADGRVSGVRLADGRQVPADLVIAGVGAEPEIGLAQRMGLTCHRGIVIDEHCQTSDPNVLAIGDCAMGSHPHKPDALHSMESVQSAIEQGKLAASTIVGQEAASPAVPWFWSHQGEFKMQMAGVSDGFDDLTIYDQDETGLTVLYFREGQFIAADCINRPSHFMSARRALKKGQTICPRCAAEGRGPLKELLMSPAELHAHLIEHPFNTVALPEEHVAAGTQTEEKQLDYATSGAR